MSFIFEGGWGGIVSIVLFFVILWIDWWKHAKPSPKAPKAPKAEDPSPEPLRADQFPDTPTDPVQSLRQRLDALRIDDLI